MNLIFYHFNCSERLLKSHHVFLVPVVAVCSQLLLKSVSKLFKTVEWSNSLLRHFKIQTLLKINCSMAAISAFGVTQHCQIFSLFFRNRIQCIVLYQLHNSQALLNLCRGYCSTARLGTMQDGRGNKAENYSSISTTNQHQLLQDKRCANKIFKASLFQFDFVLFKILQIKHIPGRHFESVHLRHEWA